MPDQIRGSRPTWTLDPAVKHLNHGSFGAVPEAVQVKQEQLRARVESNPVRWFASLPERVERARISIAKHLGADPERTAFVLNASAGASAVFQSLMNRGPVSVLTTNHGYGAITMGAERLASRTGGRASTVDIPLDASAQTAYALIDEALQARPTLLIIDQITSATARQFPVDDICRRARELGVLTLVDGAHAPGVLPHPVCHEADYWVGNLHKFVSAPRGAAVIVARDAGEDLYPVIDSWGSPSDFPQRFNHSGTSDVTQWLVSPFAWEHLEETIGWSTIQSESRALLDRGVDLVSAALAKFVDDPVPSVGQAVGPMRLLRLPRGLGQTHPEADALRVPFIDEVGIALAFTNFEGNGYMRLSAHVYNHISDYEYLAEVGVPALVARAQRTHLNPIS